MTTTSSAPGTHQHVGDLERLLPRVGLGDEQLVDVDTDGPGVHRVHRVLGVDVGADAAVALGLGDDVHRQGGLAGGLRTEDLDHAPSGQTTDAEREVERQRPGGTASIAIVPFSPIRMMEPLPNCLSIWASAMSSAFSRSMLMSFPFLADHRPVPAIAGLPPDLPAVW